MRVLLRRKNIKSFLNNVTKGGITANKNLWTFIKPFLTNKVCLVNKDITLIEGNKFTVNKRELSKLSKNILTLFRSSRPEVFCKKVFLKISQNPQENICARVTFLIKLQAWRSSSVFIVNFEHISQLVLVLLLLTLSR